MEEQSYPLPLNISISEVKYHKNPSTRLGTRQKMFSENTIPENAWDFQKQAHFMHFNIQFKQSYGYKK